MGETLGVLVSIVAVALSLYGTIGVFRVSGSKFTKRDYTFSELGGGKAVSLYVDAVRMPTAFIVAGLSLADGSGWQSSPSANERLTDQDGRTWIT